MDLEKNIIIIYVPRSGSTNLMKAFNDTHICLNEPFSIKEGDTFQDFLNLVENGDRPIVLKTGTDHVPKDFNAHNHEVSGPWQNELNDPTLDDGDKWLDFFDVLLPYFKTIILLDRRDYDDHLIAWNHLVSRIRVGQNPHEKYDVIENLKGDFHYYFDRSKERLKIISKKLNKQIDYYEDIYYGDTQKFIESLGFEFTKNMKKTLDTSNRYRRKINEL